ncbi:hypothetical protein AKJ09_06186 [Labilithrix luteola]|uniref:Uncharacterized protein n=1 Tax=Labilithrix luteola TaxID=1391654 RepID=A0A0K1Q1A3_9BACT|nr:hypothetical protein AKJ09_06186 [Labilithrix luteola]
MPANAMHARIVDARNDKGSLEMYAPGPGHVLVTRAVGHMTMAMAEQWVARTEHLFTFPKPLAVFNEWSRMESYESAARSLLTKWVISHRTKIEGAWFLTGSKLVKMGVAVAGSATALVGVTMHASLDRAQWESLLREKLTRPA